MAEGGTVAGSSWYGVNVATGAKAELVSMTTQGNTDCTFRTDASLLERAQ